MNNEYNILKSKLEKIIKDNSKSDYAEEFKGLLNELNGLKNDSVSLTSNSFFSKMIASIRAKFVKPVEKEFDNEKYEEIKRKAIYLYRNKILFNEIPAIINTRHEGVDAYFKKSYTNTPAEKLLREMEKYVREYTRLKEKPNGNIEIYPWKVGVGILERLLEKEYSKMSERLLTTECDVDEVIKERLQDLSAKNKAIEDAFLKANVEPYYGSPEFITKRSEYIVECMEKILSEKDIKEERKEKTRELIDNARFILNKIENCQERIFIRQNDRTYDEMKRHFEKMLSIEDVVFDDVEKIWNEFLTKPEDYKEGSRFAFLVHTYTKGVVGADELERCCCTLITDKCMPVPYGNMGIICGFNKENIKTMCSKDADSWVIDKQHFLESNIPVEWQFAESIGNTGNIVYYTNPKISKLLLPTTMEKEMIENNLSFREKFKDGARDRLYSELFMSKGKNGEKIPVQELFYTDEQGREKAKKVKGDYNPLFIDPSKGTEVPFYDEENKSKPIGKIKEEDK